jgi:hypothetical protein
VYYRWGEIKSNAREDKGYDTVRRAVIGNRDFKLKHF